MLEVSSHTQRINTPVLRAQVPAKFSPGCPSVSEESTSEDRVELSYSQAPSQGCPQGKVQSAAELMAESLVGELENGCPIGAPKDVPVKVRKLLEQSEEVALKTSTGASSGPVAAAVENHQAKKKAGGCPFLGRLLGEQAPSAVTQKVGALEFTRGILKHHKDPVEFFEDFHSRHGESFQVKVPGRRMIFDHRPEVMRGALLATDRRRGDSTFHKPELQGHGLSFLMGKDNIFLAGGETWKSVNDIVSPQFSSKKINSDQFMGKMGRVVDAHVERLKSDVGESKTIDIKTEMQRATLDVLMQTILGTELSESELNEAQQSFQTMMKNLSVETLNPTNVSVSKLPWKSDLKKAYANLEDLAERVIQVNQGKPAEENAVTALLEADIPHQRVKNEVLTLMLAGHETTATLLSWSFAELARDKDLQDKLRLESAMIQEGSGQELRSAKQIGNTVLETLRLYSPAYFLVRESSEEQTLDTQEGPLSLKKGDQLIMSSYNMHRDREGWGQDADRFDPERFARKKAFMAPFGAGTRTCIGQVMARNEAALILGRFLQNFEWTAEGPIGMMSDVSVAPENSLITLKPLREKAEAWNLAA